MRPRNPGLHALPALALGACAALVDPAPDYDAARKLVRETTGLDAVRDPEGPVLAEEEIRAVLADGLTLDEALTLALENNRRLQAGFLELGVGRADFVQAGLLENPTLSLAFLIPSGGGRARIGADLVQSVAELWQLKHRKELARLGQDRRILDLSRFAGELVQDARAAYFEAVAARELRGVAGADVDFARTALAAVRRQVEVGVATRTEESLAEGEVLAAELAYRLLERAESSEKQRLAALLSLQRGLGDAVLADPLPAAAALAGADDSLVERGAASRIDVRAARSEVLFAEAQVRLEQRRANPGVAAGFAAERTESGGASDLVGGVAGSIELPLFDQNQAQIRRAEYRRDAVRKELEALLAEVSAEIRIAQGRARVARDAAEFVEQELLPQAERAAAQARRAYELGDTTVLALLESRRRVALARREAVRARLEIARAGSALERSVGAPLDPARE
jgi:cobalt-zinc-cadmium efflux system outer membrane protein